MVTSARTGIELAAGLALVVAGCQSTPEPPHDAKSPAAVVAAATSSEGKVFDPSTTSIDARVGDHFTVALPGNVTTPFEWRADPASTSATLAVSEPKYTDAPPPGCGPHCLGYGGTYAFPVVASAAGNAKLHFVYAHVGRGSAPPTKEVTIDVKVAP